MLFLVATPIGNLADFSPRAVETLNGCDYILCEDTRHSGILLKHFGIKRPTKSFHRFNEAKMEGAIIKDLKEGLTIALIGDAGTPLINDPGERLVRKCQEEKIKVSAIPGPCSPITALILSGFPTDRFQCVGFLPRTKGKLNKALGEFLIYPGTTICLESPYRILATLKALHLLAPQQKIAIARELTKKHEEMLHGTPEELLTHFNLKPPKGELVFLLSGQREKSKTLKFKQQR